MPLSSKTCELSMDDAYEASSMLCRAASRAKTSPTPASALASKTEPEAASGPSSPESFAKLSAEGSWLKTSGGYSQLMMGGGSEEFSGTWPNSGSMRSGSCYPLPTLEPRTSASAFGSSPGSETSTAPPRWPTPTSSQARSEGMILQMRAKVDAGELSIEEAERMIGGSLTPSRMAEWPTPTVADSKAARNATARRPNGNGQHHSGVTMTDALILNGDMEMPPTGQWPTPTSRDGKDKDAANRGGGGQSLCEAVRGRRRKRATSEAGKEKGGATKDDLGI